MAFKDKVVNLVLRGKDLFTPTSDKVAGTVNALTEKVGQLRQQFTDLKGTQRELAQAKALSDYAAKSEQALKDARAEVDRTAKAYDDLKRSSKAQAQSVESSSKAAKDAKRQYQSLTQKLTTQLAILQSAGIETDDLSNAQSKLQLQSSKVAGELTKLETIQKQLKQQAHLTTHLETTSKALDKARGEMQSYARAIDKSTQATTEQRTELKQAEATVRRLSADYDKNATALANLNAALDTNLAGNKRYASSQGDLQKETARLTLQLDRLRQLQRDGTAAQKFHIQQQESKRRLNETSIEAKRQAKAFEQVDTELSQHAQSLKRASAEAGKAEATFTRLSGKLAVVKNRLANAGVNTNDLSAANDKLSRKLREVESALRSNRSQLKAMSGQLAQVKEKAKDAAVGIKGLAGELLAIGGAYLGIRETVNGLNSLLATGGQFEDFRAQLAAAYGDIAKGDAAFEWIREFSRETPNTIAQVIEAFLMLKNNGMEPMNGSLRKLIAANTKYGRGQETLIPIIRQLTQAWGKGQLTAEDANTTIENGLPIWQLLSQAMNRSVGELKEMSQNGLITRNALVKLFDEMERTSLDALAGRMQTWNAQLTKFQDLWIELKSLIADSGVLEFFKNELTAINTQMREMAEDGRLRAIAAEWSAWIIGTARATKAFVTDIVSSMDEFALRTSQAMGAIQLVFNGFTIAIKGTATAVLSVWTRMAEESAKILRLFGPEEMAAKATNAANALRAITDEFAAAVKQDADDINNALERISGESHAKLKASFQDVGSEATKAGEAQRKLALQMQRDAGTLNDLITEEEEAFKQLGVTSTDTLQNMAKDAKLAYDTIKAGNASLSQQRKAFLAYAQQALIAASATGQQVDASVRLEATALGLTEAFDKLTDKYAQQNDQLQSLAKSTHDASDAQVKVSQQHQSASEQIQQNSYQTAQQVQGDSATIVKSAKEAGVGLQSIAQYFYDIGQAVQANVAKLSKGAVEYFKQLRFGLHGFKAEAEGLGAVENQISHLTDVIRELDIRLASTIDFVGLRTWALETEKAGKIAERAYYRQQLRAMKLTEALNDTNLVNQQLVASAERASTELNLLNKQDLSALTSALDSAKAHMEQLEDTAKSTLRGLQDELDQMLGKEADIEQRQYQDELTDIRQQLEAARKAGNEQLISELKEAEQVLQRLHKLRLDEIKASKQQNQAQDEPSLPSLPEKQVVAPSQTTELTPPAPTYSPVPTDVVTLRLMVGNTQLDTQTEKRLIERFLAEINRLQRLSA